MKLLFDITLLLSLLATGVSLNAVANDNGGEFKSSFRVGSRRMEENCQSVNEVICSLGNTRTFCELVTRFSETYTTFADGLEGGRPYTVFAFTDEAFKATEQEFLDLSPEEIYRTILFHFYEDVVLTYEDLDCSTKLVSLTGDTSRTKCRRISAGVYDKNQRGRGNQAIGDWPEIESSKEACTGIVHRIDHVMLPILFKPFEALVVEAEPLVVEVEPEDSEEEELPEVEEIPALSEVEEVPETEAWSFEIGAKANEEVNDYVLEIGAKETDAIEYIDEVAPVEETESEEEVKEPIQRIGALGINLIILSTLVLCFVFVCLRR